MSIPNGNNALQIWIQPPRVDLASNERVRRRNAVQQQLDKSSALEDQLQEMIEVVEEMNYKLADKVKSAKKDM